KLWSSITTDPYFINLHETRSLQQPNLLLCIRKNDSVLVYSIPEHTQISNRSNSSFKPIDLHHMKFPRDYSYFCSRQSVHGLICSQESRKPIIWNPSKRQFLTLPKPWRTGLFLGHDPIEGKYKVLCVPYKKTCYECRVLTLGSAQVSWKKGYTNAGRCIKGVIYYLATKGKTHEFVLMSFDVRSETLDTIGLPSVISFVTDIYSDKLINYRGRLACMDNSNGGRLWILVDAEKHKWSCQNFHSPLSYHDPSLRTFKLRGCTQAGELIYLPDKFHKPFEILLCDPVRNSYRRFELKGITDSYRRFELKGIADDHGGENNMYQIYAFPNHIESMSL
ncbi:hypothetical protein EUTSA_v10017831mg, partial [Eutrema salsugineum]